MLIQHTSGILRLSQTSYIERKNELSHTLGQKPSFAADDLMRQIS
jgi:hypothetical protein